MSPLRILSLLVLVAVIGVVSSASLDTCTAETCNGGPVMIRFSNTNCTGDSIMFNYYDDAPSTYGNCIVDSATASHHIEVTDLFVVYTEVNNPTCSMTPTNASYWIQQDIFGLCVPSSNGFTKKGVMRGPTSSYIILANANATYTAPQPAAVVDTNFPDVSRDTQQEDCPSLTNCTNAQGVTPTFIQYATTSDCSVYSAYGTYNNSYDGRTCYREGELFYTTTHCVDEHTYANLYYLDSACQNFFSAEYKRRVCTPDSDSTRLVSCLAAPIPYAPLSYVAPVTPVAQPPSTPSAVPTSTATSTIPSFILLLASVIALLF